MTKSLSLALLTLIASTSCTSAPRPTDQAKEQAQAQAVTPETLANEWRFYGLGSHAAQNRMFYMAEAPDSQGVMLVSTEPYEGDITIRYELMPMNPASVCVAILHASDPGEATSLTLPEDYDGSMGHWINQVDNYFFAFHNMAHDRTPFGIRFPAKTPLGENDKNVMQSGRFHTIEISKRGQTISLTIDGQRCVTGTDPDPLNHGHLAFRLRGIPQQPAACLIRNLVIEPHP